jgi:MFS family permease
VHRSVGFARHVVFRLPAGVVRGALVVRLLDEWWAYLPAGTIEDQRLDLGISYAQAGWLLAMLTIGGLVGSPIASLADLGYRRLLAVAGALVLAGGLGAFAFGAPYPLLVLAAACLGAASDLVIRPLESSLAEVAGDDLDRQLGRQHLVTWFGDFIGPALLALGAATAIGWQGVFGITAVVFVGFALTLAVTEFPAPLGVGDDHDASLWRSARRLVRNREVLLLTVAEFILLPLDEAFLGFAVARVVGDGFGAAAQVLAGGVVVGGICGSLVIARRGLDRRRTAVALGVMGGGAFVAATPIGVVGQTVAMAALGFGTALVWAKVHHRMLTVIPGRSATVPTVVSVLSTPALVFPVAMGIVSDRWSITAALAATAALTIPLAWAVLSLGGDRITPDELDELD